ncbi:hypothetical protein DFH11DRAFT_344717 [Phellopilus nigrolimitatus]|nr:hypothetical protein DFH11DRAFT_344717 [Phellopilus nigrolimitatus]
MSAAAATLARLRLPLLRTRRKPPVPAIRCQISSSSSEVGTDPVSVKLSTVHRGNAFERRATILLRDLSMSLLRVGGKDDGGVDLMGWWWLPSSTSHPTRVESPVHTHESTSSRSPTELRTDAFEDLNHFTTDCAGIQRRRVRVLAQCKAERKKLGPNYVREMEGVLLRHSLPPDPASSVLPLPSVALLVSESAFTKATVLRALSSPLPFMLLHLPLTPLSESVSASEKAPDTFGTVIWNSALGGQHGLLAGEIDLRWERVSSAGVSERPSLWWRGLRLDSWAPSFEP